MYQSFTAASRERKEQTKVKKQNERERNTKVVPQSALKAPTRNLFQFSWEELKILGKTDGIFRLSKLCLHHEHII